MKTFLECMPCLGKNAVDMAKRSTADNERQKQILSEALHLLADSDYSMPPPHLARKIADIALAHTGKDKLYAEEKKRSNKLARQLVAELPNIPEYHEEQFESRLRLAVAGNILDFGIFTDLDIQAAMAIVKSALTKPLDADIIQRLQRKMDSAQRILYILDNCGEAVFDHVFLEPYKNKVTLGVRGREIFNDVTEDDLADCGFDGWNFISNGPIGVPGTILSECDAAFLKAFREADLIIAKGQGNFETMNEYPNPIAFLFLAKCPVVIREIGAEPNSIQIRLQNL